LRAEFEAKRGQILAGLLDLLAKVLAVLPDIELSEPSRMADFDRVLAAVDRVLGSNALAQYRGQRDRVARDVVESDPVALAVLGLATQAGEWCGTATELLERLTPDNKPRSWPDSARKMASRIRRAVPALARLGVEVLPPSRENRGAGRDRARIYTIRALGDEADETVQTVQPSETGADGADDRDQARTVQHDLPSDRPRNRPPKSGREEAEKGGSDGVDDVDGTDPISSDAGGTRPVGACFMCSGRLWWRLRDAGHGAPGGWLCARCHPPDRPEGEVEEREAGP